MKGFHLIPANTNFPFLKARFLTFVLSTILIIASIFLLSTRGLNFGIDFTGGTLIEIKTPETPNLGTLRQSLNSLGLGSVSIQEFGEPDDLIIRIPQQTEETPDAQAESNATAQDMVRTEIDKQFEGEVDYRRTEFVGPQVGDELKQQGLYAILFALAGIMIYVWIRFEWQFGVSALLALLHDTMITLGFFALTQMQFDLSTVAALLMIAGYSINDTVVVFDRIRENLRKFKKMPLIDLFTQTVNETLSRTVMTSLTTLLALVALYIFGGEVIRGFVVALILGIVVGTYSSIFIAAPLLLYFRIRRR
jgi:preprotein translocase subunit SecF